MISSTRREVIISTPNPSMQSCPYKIVAYVSSESTVHDSSERNTLRHDATSGQLVTEEYEICVA
jgi:hypothetical protein